MDIVGSTRRTTDDGSRSWLSGWGRCRGGCWILLAWAKALRGVRVNALVFFFVVVATFFGLAGILFAYGAWLEYRHQQKNGERP